MIIIGFTYQTYVLGVYPKLCVIINSYRHFLKIDHEYVLFSESSVSHIYFDLASISKNRSSNFRGFPVVCVVIEQ